MKKTDKKLEYWLLKQLKDKKPLSDKLIKTLKNPRYSNGKLIRFGDLTISMLEATMVNQEDVDVVVSPMFDKKFLNENDAQIPNAQLPIEQDESPGISKQKLTLLVFSSEDLDEVCKNYWYAGGRHDSAIYVIKRS